MLSLWALFRRAVTHSNFLSPGSLGKMAAKFWVPTSPIWSCLKLGEEDKDEGPSACHPSLLAHSPPGSDTQRKASARSRVSSSRVWMRLLIWLRVISLLPS